MSAPPKPTVRVHITYPALTHRFGKFLRDIMSYQLSRKDCITYRMFCHNIGDGAGTRSRSIKEGQGKSMSSEMRQTMTAKSV